MNWTVSRRIAAGFALILALVVALAWVGIHALRSTTEAYDAAQRRDDEVMKAALMAEMEVQEANLQYQRFLLKLEDRFIVSRDSAATRSRALLESLRTSPLAAEHGPQWAEALDRLAAWDEASRESVAAARDGRQEEALRIYDEEAYPALRALRTAVDRAVEQTQASTAAAGAAAATAAERMRRLLMLASAVALAVGVISAFLLDRAVTGPLRETTGVLASSAAEILAASTQQAASASETSAAVIETSTTVDEVAQTAEQAAERAKAVAGYAQRAAEIGRAGRQAVDESSVAMAELKEQVEAIADSILVLAEQAQSIGEIIATVNKIADQTNLLALNAAVEAARAGEHGRGFAVVAGEVRSLADQAIKSTVQVRQILGEIQRATGSAVMTTERGTQQVTSVTAQVRGAGETIRELAEAAGESAQAAAQIVASAGQQAIGMAQIRQAIGSIQEATQQNLASTRQTEQAAADLNSLGNRVLQLVQGTRGALPPA